MRTRVFIEDARKDGGFLRVTWHAEARQFVISNWEDSVCVGATRVPLEEAPALVALLVDGIADAAHPRTTGADPPRTLPEHLRAWWTQRGRQAQVLPFRRTR